MKPLITHPILKVYASTISPIIIILLSCFLCTTSFFSTSILLNSLQAMLRSYAGHRVGITSGGASRVDGESRRGYSEEVSEELAGLGSPAFGPSHMLQFPLQGLHSFWIMPYLHMKPTEFISPSGEITQ